MSIRVLHIIDHMRFGGAQRIVVTLANRQPLTKIYSLRRGSSTDIAEIPAGKLRFGAGTIPGPFATILDLVRLIRQEKIDIVHCHLRLSFLVGLILALYFSKKNGPQFVFHEHGPILFSTSIYRYLLSRVVRFGVVVTCSQYVKDAILKARITGDIRVIRNFVDENRFYTDHERRHQFRQKHRLREDDVVIGFAGRVVPQKGCYELVQAFAKLSQASNARLMIAGHGSDVNRIRDYILQNDLSARVVMLGYVSDMNEFYNGIDVFVIPSFREPLGMVQLEAQMCGKPVVASDVPGIRETVDASNALLFPAGDVNALAAALERLTGKDRDLHAELASAGLRNASRFLLARYLEQIDILYMNILNREPHDAL